MKGNMLMKALLGKELRTMLRDRQQLFALVIGVASAVFTAVSIEVAAMAERRQKEADKASREAEALLETAGEPGGGTRDEPGDEKEKPAGTTASRRAGAGPGFPMTDGVRCWMVILAAAGMAWYGSFFALPLALATFVGEKEKGTLEVLLMTPPSDRALYLFKFLSVTIPSSIYGGVLMVLLGAYVLILHGRELEGFTPGVIVAGALLSLPFPFLLSGFHVGLGAICSVRARTTQGAGLLLGGLITVVLFAVFGLAAVLFLTPLKEPAFRAFLWWIRKPFLLQYATVVALLVFLTAVSYGVGRALFRRETMLLG